MSITAIVENDTVKLPVHVPDGTSVEIILPEKRKAGNSPVKPDFMARLMSQYGERCMSAEGAAAIIDGVRSRE